MMTIYCGELLSVQDIRIYDKKEVTNTMLVICLMFVACYFRTQLN